MALRFSKKEETTAMSKAFKDVLVARASIGSLDNVIIKGTGFPALTPEQQQAAPNHVQDLQEMQDALNAAVANGLTWANEIEPTVTILPQAYQNVFAFVKNWRSSISGLSHADKVITLQGQADRLSNEATKLDAFASKICQLNTKIDADAVNFSDKRAAFSALEQLDKESIEATVAAIAKVKVLIEEESKTIKVDLSDAENMIEIAKGVMEAGEKVKTGTEADEFAKIIAVTVGLILIGIAEGKIDEALENIKARVADASKEAVFEMNLSALTLQLIGLQTAHSVIATLCSDLRDVHQVFMNAAKWFRDREEDILAILNAGAPSTEIDEVSLMAYASAWEDLSKAGLNWQNSEASASTTFKVALVPFDPAIAPD